MISVELSPALRDLFLPPPLLSRLESAGAVVWGRQDAEVLVTGWGAARLTAAELDGLPSLRLVAHTGAA
ncbi:MAG: hydroxyacid dehydrogenase, partial [Nonomuraea sp.]|nr:hydroxyacid dehydrogenase [Nonomuraea sp.]